MSGDGETLLRAVLAEPDDDTVRLAFADWLRENDEPERAELIQVQIELAQMTTAPPMPHDPTNKRYWELRAREDELIGDKGRRPAPGVYFQIMRGLVSHVTCAGDDWVRMADALTWHESQDRPCPRTAQPLAGVKLTTWPTLARDPASSTDMKRHRRRYGFNSDPKLTSRSLRLPRLRNDFQRVKKLLGEFWTWLEFELPNPVPFVTCERADLLPRTPTGAA